MSPPFRRTRLHSHAEAEARALSHRLRREELIEDAVAIVGGDACSVVDDPDDDEVQLAPQR